MLSIYRIGHKQELDFKMIDVAVFIRDHWIGKELQYSRRSVDGISDERHLLPGTDQLDEGLHAMLLIGTRKTDDDEYFFLLQNWWEGRFFVEVSADYLYSSEATISFVEEDITEIPTAFASVLRMATDVRG